MSGQKQSQSGDFNIWLSSVLKQAHDIGYAKGFENGIAVGYALALEQTKPAVSDGLRNGSSECGKNMRSRRKK